jgi:hypothetical protein
VILIETLEAIKPRPVGFGETCQMPDPPHPPVNRAAATTHLSLYDLREIGASNPGTPATKGLQDEPEHEPSAILQL